MAIYRPVQVSYWQDAFVLDLTPEEKYFYLYLMTNSKTSQSGIYELPFDQFLNRLGNGRAGIIQRDIIYKRYLEEEDVCDYMVYNEIGMSERTYRRWKSKAFYKLAFALGLEVYEAEETGGNGQ
ncbi:ArpU family phage transcriptional regulator [Bacillus cereus VD140]|nr:ArpU family phage transcriptional regulator [Bacillus cereus VD140]